MQRHKTKIYEKNEFQIYCDNMLNDNPINELEEEMINIINLYSADPYSAIEMSDINEVDREVFSEERIENILMSYLTENKDYQRVRWLFRRLSNVGIDTGINLAVREINKLMPAINDVALYFASVAEESTVMLSETGESLLTLLNNPIIQSNDFFKITILNLFTNTNKFNNVQILVGMFNNATDYIKREIILAGYTSGLKSWIREVKQEYQSLGLWAQRALLIASELLPKDERKFFIQSIMQTQNNLSMIIIARNVKQKP